MICVSMPQPYLAPEILAGLPLPPYADLDGKVVHFQSERLAYYLLVDRSPGTAAATATATATPTTTTTITTTTIRTNTTTASQRGSVRETQAHAEKLLLVSQSVNGEASGDAGIALSQITRCYNW